jgi:5-methyltetrahydrofolate--homocysteine methyltransferase
VHVFETVDLSALRDYIDWTPFFRVWELPGKYPKIFSRPGVGDQARKVFDDAQRMIEKMVEEGILSASAVAGLFPANSDGDDILVYEDETRSRVAARLCQLRSQEVRIEGEESRCLADWIAPVTMNVADYIGCFALTAGHGLPGIVASFQRDHDDYHAILARALADRFAEALAEWLHEHVRKELWGYAPDEALTKEDLLRENYRGIRPAPGYPASPDHSEKLKIWQLLKVEDAINIKLTDNCAMVPAASISGLYISHPDSRYFNIGRFERDQVEEYAERKGFSRANVERWLASNLAYSAY